MYFNFQFVPWFINTNTFKLTKAEELGDHTEPASVKRKKSSIGDQTSKETK